MLLAIDCGNTNTVFSVWDGEKFLCTLRTSTDCSRVRATCWLMSCRFTPSLWRSVSTMAPTIATSRTSPAAWKK